MKLKDLFLLLLSDTGVCGDMQALAQLSSRVLNQGGDWSGLRHIPVRYPGNKQKLCVSCTSNSTRTKSGWHVYTRFYCLACDLPLCRGEPRHCFAKYHNLT